MSADTDGSLPRTRSSREQVALPTGPGRGAAGGTEPEEFWDLYGTQLFALSCALLGNEAAALRAVSLAMVDLYSPSADEVGLLPEVTLRSGAECVYNRCHAGLAETPLGRTITIPPLMVWLGELAMGQRASLALCVFGGHTYQQAATRLDISSELVADLLTSGLHDLCRLAAPGDGSTA